MRTNVAVSIPREVRDYFMAMNWENAEWALLMHRGKRWRARRCSGEAHSNPCIDHCSICAPLWGIIVERV